MTISYALGAPVMLQLGAFQFGINTAAHQGLNRSDGWRWPAQERIGQEAALQHIGPAETTITLDGVIFPEWRGGFGQLDAMGGQAGWGAAGAGQCVGEKAAEPGGGFARRKHGPVRAKRATRGLPFLLKTGAGEESRTPDLRITNALLYQLSYTG